MHCWVTLLCSSHSIPVRWAPVTLSEGLPPLPYLPLWACWSMRRYSRGGVAVQQQYRSVVRLMKEARQQGRRGTSYVDLVQQALAALPDK